MFLAFTGRPTKDDIETKLGALRAGGEVVRITGDWRLSLSADPVRRLPFDTHGKCRLTLENPVTGARLVTRGAAVLVDGKSVAVSAPCNLLRPSFDPLYRKSEPFDLAVGEHEFRLPDGILDRNWFLPAAFLAEPARERICGAGSLEACGLAGFCGSATWTKTVDVPTGAEVTLQLETGGHFARVTLGGKDLGAIGWGDFAWEIPEILRGGRHELAITVYTSLAPLFGAIEPPGAEYWGNNTPPRLCGLLASPVWFVDGSTPHAEGRSVIGVVNWDCSLPSDTYFGHYATTSLSPSKYRYATPYYADVKGPDRIDYHLSTRSSSRSRVR